MTASGKSVSNLLAALLTSGAALAQPCLEPGTWYSTTTSTPRRVDAADLLEQMSRRAIVLLGEQHDRADHHVWQLQTLAALHALRPNMVIGFEQFPRRAQPVLDAWIAGKLTEKQFLEQSEWRKVWNYPPELYMPLYRFARINGIPMVALNVDAALTRAVADKGWDGVSAALKEGLSRPAPPQEAYLDMLFSIYKEHPMGTAAGAPQRSDAGFLHFVDSQTVWDHAFAEALMRSLAPPTPGVRPLVAGIIGSGHLRNGYGVRHQLRALGAATVGTLLPVAADTPCKRLGAGYADAIFTIPTVSAQDAAPRPRLGVRLEFSKGAVRIAQVLRDSLAETSGLKDGDVIVSLAGSPVHDIHAVIATVRGQPAGTWLPVQVRRGAATVDLIVKFPPGE